jgi:nitrite reductase (NADH) large subunit
VDVDVNWDLLWRDNINKQITGYSILGLSVLGLLVSLRKRWKIFTFLEFSIWRYAHIALGVLALVGIFVHTGFRLGENLNYWLMAPFLGLILIGSMTALFMSFQHRLDAARAKGIRDTLVWGHILTFWPIPAMLVMHITKTYYF